MRLLLITGLLLLIFSCKKTDTGPSNELPLEEVKGKILYTNGVNLVEMDIQSGISKEIEKGLGALASWSPDGKLRMWSDRINAKGALVIKITDSLEHTLFEFDPSDVHEACWSPDGKQVAFFNIEKNVVTKIDLTTLDRDTFKFNVGNLFSQPSRPDWSPDGKTFVFAAFDYDIAAFNIWKVDSDGGNLVKLSNETSYPQWSPDGKEIAYVYSSSVHAMSADGSHFRILLPEGLTPHWSFDGKLIMYTYIKTPGIGSEGSEIRVRNLETGQERLIVEHATLLDWYSL